MTTTAEGVARPEQGTTMLEVDAVTKSFGHVDVLRGVSLTAREGEVTALIGGNGAGKSTLIRIIAGVLPPDAGSITFAGEPYEPHSAADGRALGIETVYQNLALVDELTVWQNMFLNREMVRRVGPMSFLDRRGMSKRAGEMLQDLEVKIPSVASRVQRLSGGQRQGVAICRATGWGGRFVVMDEPTAALGVQETERVERLIRRLRDQGKAILLVSHNFDQVLRVSDQVWVLRQGRIVGGRRASETNGRELVDMITGVQHSDEELLGHPVDDHGGDR
jgi:D-xylose transport system ATP-binding protein